MLTSNDQHVWSATGLDGSWVVPGYHIDHNTCGGSASDYPKDTVAGDARRHLSFWGSDLADTGGCCSTSTGEYSTGWEQSFTLSYGVSPSDLIAKLSDATQQLADQADIHQEDLSGQAANYTEKLEKKNRLVASLAASHTDAFAEQKAAHAKALDDAEKAAHAKALDDAEKASGPGAVVGLAVALVLASAGLVYWVLRSRELDRAVATLQRREDASAPTLAIKDNPMYVNNGVVGSSAVGGPGVYTNVSLLATTGHAGVLNAPEPLPRTGGTTTSNAAVYEEYVA
jgi:hypothetical protein